MPICDGCGERVDEDHIRQRIERLELATRFRPIHINVLLIDAAPPARREDFFYDALRPFGVRSAEGQAYLAEVTKLAGSTINADTQLEPILGEFQHRGFFLTSAVECPVSDSSLDRVTILRFAPTVILRVKTSYQPKHIALISEPTRGLIEPLRGAGWGDRLILDNGAPFDAAVVSRARNPSQAATSLGDRLLARVSQRLS